jgi:hypothetical protein
MEITMKFKLPEDDFIYKLTTKASQMHWILNSFDAWLRLEIKHGSDEFTADERDVLDRVRTRLQEAFQEHNFVLEDLLED